MATSIIEHSKISLLEVKTGSATMGANSDVTISIPYARTYDFAVPVLGQVTSSPTWQYVTQAITYKSNSSCSINFHNLANRTVTIDYQLLVFGY